MKFRDKVSIPLNYLYTNCYSYSITPTNICAETASLTTPNPYLCPNKFLEIRERKAQEKSLEGLPQCEGGGVMRQRGMGVVCVFFLCSLVP